MKNKASWLYLVTGIALLLAMDVSNAWAQYQIQHRAPTGIERQAATTLTFDVPGINPSDVQDAFIFYKIDGDISYQQKNARLVQSSFEADLTIENENATILEYYFEIQFTNGETATYPVNLGEQGPIRVEVIDPKEEQVTSGEQSGIDYTILSPEPGEQITPNDAVLAVALFYEEGTIDTTQSLEFYLDDKNITEQSEASDYFLTYVPEELTFGEHSASLRLRTGDNEEEIVSWKFSVVDRATLAAAGSTDPFGTEESESFIPSGQAELTARNQVIAGNNNDVLSGNVRLSGRKGNVRYTAYGLLTSQADPRIQPQNRYGAELYIGNWFEVQAGHIYPTLSPLTITGQRIQGINTAVRPFNGAVNVQFLFGKMRRSISNLYQSIKPDPQEFNGTVVDTSYTLGFQNNGVGTYDRDVIGGRLAFGRGNNFQFGINALKVEDDTSSIDVISNYNDVLENNQELASGLSQQDRNKLQAEPNLLSVNGNPAPKGNFVTGADLTLGFDNNRIQFRSDAAISLLNDDISAGPLNSQRADDLGFTLDQDTEDLLDQLSWLIIINENLTALPLRFDVSGSETTAEFFFPTSIVGTQSELSLNYFKNNFRLKYRWVGPDFNSLANSTTRRDIAGITVTDRFRLLQNRLYVTLGYENLDDNVANTRDATTNTTTYRGNVSWYPIKRELPRVSLGLMSRTRDNEVELFNPFVGAGSENIAVRNYETVNGTDTVTVPNARMANTTQFTTSISQQFDLFGITHDASVNYSLLNTNDDVFAFGDAKSNSFSLNVTNRFRDMPLDTKFGFSVNNTETGGGLTDINIVGVNLGGSMYFMEDKLNVNAALAFTKNTTETISLGVDDNGTPNDPSDDIYEESTNAPVKAKSNSFIFSAGARYDLDENHAFLANMRFTNVSSPTQGLLTPNDRILQIRYIFSF
ncbi:MAG: hypothetical protein U5J95_08445 [Balneolaceae bacterium]|nr:hypothetical protein [Balneolaceae bacterium]